MTETTGVTESRGSESRGSSGGKIAPFFRKNKLLVIGGGGVGLILLMAHRGSSTAGGSTGSSANQLQAAADYAAAQQSAALQDPSLLPGGTAPVDTGGGSYTAQGPTATAAPAPVTVGPIDTPVTPTSPDVTINFPSGDTTSGAAPAAASKAKAKAKAKSQGKKPAAKPAPKKSGTPASHNRAPAPSHPKPSQPHPTPPHPATKAGTHPASPKKTAAGHKKKSPVEVEAMAGAGAGVMVSGRHFPGARGYREGPPLRGSDGRVARMVTLDYGGHTETHMVHGDGDYWTDRPRGVNPPSRGVPVDLPGMNHAVL